MITTQEYTSFVLDNYHTTFNPPMAYISLGLAGETGEAVDAVKKIIRGDFNKSQDSMSEQFTKVALELGDVLYYTVRLAHEFGYSIEDIMQMNKDKLVHRKKYGKAIG